MSYIAYCKDLGCVALPFSGPGFVSTSPAKISSSFLRAVRLLSPTEGMSTSWGVGGAEKELAPRGGRFDDYQK